jgi:outer membrane protein OmpA-like peptidoglycan-associated protein/ABC-type taurine transport system substrate-binding protein
MSTKRFRLTKTAKIMVFCLILTLLGSGVFVGIKTGLIKTKDKTNEEMATVVNKDSDKIESKNDTVNNVSSETNDTNVMDDTINISLDEWIGWKSIIDANKGLTTQPDSIYGKLGINVNINIINDATQSSNALIKGDLNAAGYTINRTAFLSNKFANANKEVIMPYITNYSNGGDGIIAKSSIMTVKDLVGAKIGVPEFSEAQTLVVWFVNNSDLAQTEKDAIIDNLILFATPDDAAKAFFAEQIDVAATWEPYLTQAQNMTDAHILFSTASSTNLVMDGVLFDKDFAEAHPDTVEKFIQGSLEASKLYDTEFDAIREVMPMFNTASDEDIIDNCVSAKLTTWKDNEDLLNGTARTIYTDMCEVWTSIGEEVNVGLLETLFDDTYIQSVSDNFSSTEISNTETVKVTEENKQIIAETEALLEGSASVTFVKNTAKFSDSVSASTELDRFIGIAKVLDGAIIEIAGNTDPNLDSDPLDEYNTKLSLQRAEAVKNYFIMNGVSADRIVVVGNGSSAPIVENDTEEHRSMNRRTDVSFKCIE